MTKSKPNKSAEIPSDPMMRMLAPSFITTEDWNTRTPTDRAIMAVEGAAERLEGLKNICWQIHFAEIAMGDPNRGRGSPYRFLAVTLDDMAAGLSATYKLLRVAEGD
jgi:hypothetical protein